MHSTSDRVDSAHSEHGLGVPSIGFVLSIALTIAALWLVRQGLLQRTQLIAGLLGLAVVQIFIQLFFFMHVNESDERAWHIWLLALGLLLVVTIVAGSIWIMSFGTEAY